MTSSEYVHLHVRPSFHITLDLRSFGTSTLERTRTPPRLMHKSFGDRLRTSTTQMFADRSLDTCERGGGRNSSSFDSNPDSRDDIRSSIHWTQWNNRSGSINEITRHSTSWMICLEPGVMRSGFDPPWLHQSSNLTPFHRDNVVTKSAEKRTAFQLSCCSVRAAQARVASVDLSHVCTQNDLNNSHFQSSIR